MRRLTIFLATSGVCLCATLVLLTSLLPRSGLVGSALVYHEFRPGVGRFYVYVDPFRLTEIRLEHAVHVQTEFEYQPLSPDGQTRVVSRSTVDGIDLFLVDATSRTTLNQITHLEDFPPVNHAWTDMRANSYPNWSPTGAWVAFLSNDPLATTDIFIIQADGTDLRRVVHDVQSASPTNLRWTSLETQTRLPVWQVGGLVMLLGCGVVVVLRR